MFSNIDALPLGSLLQTSYGGKKKRPEFPEIKNKGMVRKMMANMPAPTKLDNMKSKNK